MPIPPEAWSASEPSPHGQSTDWLEDFQSKTLTDLVAEALRYNTDLGQAVARLDAARGTAVSNGSARFPTLEGSGSGRRARITANLPPGQDLGGTGTVVWTLRASWEFDLWGRVRDVSRAARADVEANKRDVAAARLSVAGNVAQGWFNLIEARQQRELAERDVETRSRTLALIERRYRIGLPRVPGSQAASRSVDLRLARSDLAGTEAALAARLQQEQEAARALEVLLGRYPKASIERPDTLPDLPKPPDAGLPSDLLTQRPDVLAAEQRLKAAGLRVSVARKELLPKIRFTADAGPNPAPSFQNMFDLNNIAGTLVGSLTQPIFQGGRLIGDVQAARARAREALYQYTQTVLVGYREVEDALGAGIILDRRLTELRTAFEEARAGEALTERDFRRGISSIFDLLDARTRRISAESQLLTVQRERLTNRVALHVALGGNFGLPINPDLKRQRPGPRAVPVASEPEGMNNDA